MKRLAIIVATCSLGFLLTACGENKTPVVKTTTDQGTVKTGMDTQPPAPAPASTDEPNSDTHVNP